MKCPKVHQLNIFKKIQRKAFKKALERYQRLYEGETNKKWQYSPKNYKNLHEDEKTKLPEYRK